MIEDITYYSDNTIFKVHAALVKSGLSDIRAAAAIFEMQNAGILFRERGERE
jgi:hypothetical protein